MSEGANREGVLRAASLLEQEGEGAVDVSHRVYDWSSNAQS